MTVRACYINILEGASVTTETTAIESTSMPLYRIHDRDIGKQFAISVTPSTVTSIILQNMNDFVLGNSQYVLKAGWDSTSTSLISAGATAGSSSIRFTQSTGATTPTTGYVAGFLLFGGSSLTTAMNLKAMQSIKYSLRFDGIVADSTKFYIDFHRTTAASSTGFSTANSVCQMRLTTVTSTGTWYDTTYVLPHPLAEGSSAVNQTWLVMDSTVSSSIGSTFYLDNIIGNNITTSLAIKVNQGTTIQEIDALIIPSGHGLNGKTLALRYSSDDITYSTALSWTQSGTGAIFSTFTTATMQYWKLVISEPTSANTIPELFLTRTYTFERDPAIPTGQYDNVFNVENIQTASGQDRFLVHGSAKRQRNWSLASMDSTQKANLETLNNAWAGRKPFWIIDESSNLIYGKLQTPINLTYNDAKYWDADFNFIEVLP